jgi:hypothetical protein
MNCIVNGLGDEAIATDIDAEDMVMVANRQFQRVDQP